jgi:hypothetical protein
VVVLAVVPVALVDRMRGPAVVAVRPACREVAVVAAVLAVVVAAAAAAVAAVVDVAAAVAGGGNES